MKRKKAHTIGNVNFIDKHINQENVRYIKLVQGHKIQNKLQENIFRSRLWDWSAWTLDLLFFWRMDPGVGGFGANNVNFGSLELVDLGLLFESPSCDLFRVRQ